MQYHALRLVPICLYIHMFYTTIDHTLWFTCEAKVISRVFLHQSSTKSNISKMKLKHGFKIDWIIFVDA